MAQANYPATSPEGCFSSSGSLKTTARLTFDSSSACITQCLQSNSAVAAMTERFDCWCGSQFPPKSAQVDTAQCDNTCPGYPAQSCGGQGVWIVWSTGLLESPSFDSGGSSSSPSTPSGSSGSSSSSVTATPTSASTTASPHQQQTVTLDGSTIIETLAPTSTPSPSSSDSSTGTKVGAAVGIVAGVLVLAAIIAGIYFFLRRRRQNRDGHHRRNSSLNGFINSDKNPPPAYPLNDSRLDPTMVERRQSDGSIFADDQDYSRRILKVTNPDGS